MIIIERHINQDYGYNLYLYRYQENGYSIVADREPDGSVILWKQENIAEETAVKRFWNIYFGIEEELD